ncbi:hypothetical protein OJF2_68010 [Aquisphaera giovannonii]|uniref:Uncharacterized protein n=1 Tax=Aquisphaera giovannonii TaxID=406548 RepID=A0A5B9WCI8_9BACT|nr:hypothetical protein [Aquisphaera giovannonii]QEH38203.1 hypothetical protein OJF2_68010 [Aquisphaera giovannonii]
MNEDDVLKGVREAREAYARSHGFNAWAMVADLRERDASGDWPVVRLSPRRLTAPHRPSPDPLPASTPIQSLAD